MYLNCHSYYSLRHGVLSIDQLVWQAKLLGISAMAITEINCSTSLFDFYSACQKNNIKPIAGIEFRDEQHQLLYIGIAKDEDGIYELNSILSDANLQQIPLSKKAPICQHCFIIYPLSKHPKKLHKNEYVGIHYSQLNNLHQYNIDRQKLLVHQPVTFLNKASNKRVEKHTGINLNELHILLRAIDTNSLISKLNTNQKPNKDENFIDPNMLESYFKNHVYILENTQKIIDQCHFNFDFTTPKNKQHFKSPLTDTKHLKYLTWKGFKSRYKANNQTAIERVKHELAVVEELNFTSYFLITWDIIEYSKKQGFYHVGRGSGANSVVAYCLGITDVDPIELNLYFERFINASRTSPPDFDIDFSWKDRDYIYEYLFKKYGPDHIALLGTISEFKHKSILRELAKVNGLPKQEIEQLIYHPEAAKDQVSIKILTYAAYVQKHHFPNLRSIHAGGVLISQKPITYYTELDLPPKGYPTAQFDMYIAEDIGLDKLDILSQRGIGHINDSVKLVKDNKGIDLDIHQVDRFIKDPQLNKMLSTGNTIGCFYIESTAMRALIKKLNCDNYITLVAASSIIRPGVAKSGMMRAYIERHHNPNNVVYPHPIFKQHLEETYGVMVFQEDVIKICHHFAGITLEDADIIRRAMSGKYRSKAAFQAIVNQYFENCKAKGYSKELTNEIWHQISSFAGYSFAKGHSASYAVESYQSLFLKTYFPLEFMVGVINNFGGFYNTATYVHEAKRLGAEILLPCVNKSQHLTTINGIQIYLGFTHVERLEYKFAQNIITERMQNGHFETLENFMQRLNVGIEQIILLIRIGAFNFTGKSKKTLLWEAHTLYQNNSNNLEYQRNSLFEINSIEYAYPQMKDSLIENALDELELLGFTVSASYFDLLKTKQRTKISGDNLDVYIGKKVRIMGQLIHIKNVTTTNGKRMSFGTFIDNNNSLFDTINFPTSLAKYPFTGNGIYLIEGEVTQDFKHPSIEVSKMARLPLIEDPRYAQSTRLKTHNIE